MSLELTFRHIRSLSVYTHQHRCFSKHIALATLKIPFKTKNHLRVQTLDIESPEAVNFITIQIHAAYQDFAKVYNVHINALNA